MDPQTKITNNDVAELLRINPLANSQIEAIILRRMLAEAENKLIESQAAKAKVASEKKP